jgi:PAS domain S-box-containing protein
VPKPSSRPPTADPGAWEDDPALAASLFALVAAGAPWGLAACGRQGELLAMTPPLAELFGLDHAERVEIRALGRTRAAHDALVTAMERRTIAAHRPRCAAATPGTAEELALADGRVLERTCVPGAGEIAIAAFFRDVSGRRRADAELRDRARQQAALAALGELAMNAEDIEPLLHAACATAMEVLAVDAVALVEEADGGRVLLATAGLEREALPALQPGAPVAAALGFAAAAEATLPGRDGAAGRLGAYARAPRTFSADEVRFLETTASILASAVARRRAEEEVLERERQSRAVFEAALDAMLLLDDDGVIRDANPAACALAGAGRAALLGRPFDALVPDVRRRLGTQPGALQETEVALPAGRSRAVELALVPGIHPGRHLALLRDVTERKQLNARLALADRMVSVGTLAAGVAHELNNPLAYVNANLAFVAERLGRVSDLVAHAPGILPDDADLAVQLEEATRDARAGAERMRIIIRDLKTFSRGDDEKTGAVDLRTVIESCVNMAWNEIRHRARLTKELPELPPVRGNEARLGQVFLNLLVNAAQAIPEGGADGNEVAVTAHAEPDRVVVEVRDTGCGIPAEHLPRIFDPFFTTKPPGVGTGLGLSICHSIVTGLGGEISVESVAGSGTVLRVVLPVAERAAPPRAAPAAAVPVTRPRGRILVVDDEPLVGTVLERTLHGEHDVTVVTSARAALDRIDRGATFDLVLSDLLMPEMSGMDLYRALERKDPRLARRMIFLTGGAFTPAAREFLASEPVLCVEKPFELEAFRAILARRLAELAGAAR